MIKVAKEDYLVGMQYQFIIQCYKFKKPPEKSNKQLISFMNKYIKILKIISTNQF